MTAKKVAFLDLRAFALLLFVTIHGDGLAVAQENTCVFEEVDGLLIIEPETLPLTDDWKVGNKVTGFNGSGYIFWDGEDHFNTPGNGVINVKFKINTPGTYRFEWRSKIGNGDDFTEFNDTWLRFPDANEYYGLLAGRKVFPKGVGKLPEPEGSGAEGWFKVFLTGSTDWTFSTNTSDNQGYQLFVNFSKSGIYTFQVSARSAQHLIDRIVMSKDDREARDLHLPLSACLSDEAKEQGPIKATANGVHVAGEKKVWHDLNITFNGPESSETSTPNPFLDYDLKVTFTHETGTRYVIPGYYAACGNAANKGCRQGNKWRVHFSPDRVGVWNWEATFYEGSQAAINNNGTPAGFMHGESGDFRVEVSDKDGNDLRSNQKGRLQYVDEHYLRYSGTTPDQPNGPWFIKAGADATENTLDFEDFDATPNRKNLRKSWSPHAADFSPYKASDYLWGAGKGKNLLGMMQYLSDQGMNVMSFLTFTLAGDDQNVFPHLMRIQNATYETMEPQEQWERGVYHDRFDCSKLDQWDKVFSYADKLGLYLHFKLGEEENETKMDNGKLGIERKLYYRELIARFGHHLALNWNIGEENGPPIEAYMTDEDRKRAAAYLNQLDAYNHPIVLHTRPDMQDSVYHQLIGDKSELTGASVQSGNNDLVHGDILKWVTNSRASGKKWVVANDEQGTYKIGVAMDQYYPNAKSEDNREEVRSKVLWGTLMAGGAGVEYYYGYETGCGDLDCQDHRSRESKWRDARIALEFFEQYLEGHLPDLISLDHITANTHDYVFGKEEELYVVYLPEGGVTAIDLPSNDWKVQWYNPRVGGELLDKIEIIKQQLEAPDNQDWVAVVTRAGLKNNNVP